MENFFLAQLSEIAAHLLFFALGTIATFRLGLFNDNHSLTLSIFSYFVGQVLVVIITLVFLLLGIGLKLPLLLLLLISVTYWYLKIFRNSEASIKTAMSLAGFLVVLIPSLFLILNVTVLSFDSYRYVLLAKYLIQNHSYSEWLLGYSLSLSALLAVPMSLGGADLFRSLIPTSSVLWTLAIISLIISDKRQNWIVSVAQVLAVVSFVTTYFFVFSSFYVMPNLLFGLWSSMSVIFLLVYFRGTNAKAIWLFFGFLSVMVLARVEGLVFSLLFIGFGFGVLKHRQQKVNSVSVYLPYVSFLIVCVVWYLFLNTQFDVPEGDFYTNSRLTMLVLICMGLTLVPAIYSVKVLDPLLSRGLWVLVAMLVGALIVMFQLNEERFMVNGTNFLANLMEKGFWGDFWQPIFILYLSLMIVAFVSRAITSDSVSLFLLIVAFSLMVMLIFFFREQPLRLGFGDSSNRMVLHIFPVLCISIVFLLRDFGDRLFGEAR